MNHAIAVGVFLVLTFALGVGCAALSQSDHPWLSAVALVLGCLVLAGSIVGYVVTVTKPLSNGA